MTEFPQPIKFKYSWRKYQQRVLNGLDEYLKDRHLHVIAPPGSGKTILGLEVALRINQPTLILAPTTAIRNQWIQKFRELFLQIDDTPDWISQDIYHPKFMTVVTYQALYAACNNLKAIDEDIDNEEDLPENGRIKSSNKNLTNIVHGLEKQHLGVVIVDEAHHLKNEWWQTLTKVKESLDPIIVGLTATPPYDVTPLEWQRYTELNGPVDIEISVPELVIEGDLCPHQDYIFYAPPSPTENQQLIQFRKEIEALFKEIKKDETIVTAITNHPIWLNPTNNLEWIYTNLPFYSAALIFLNANGQLIPEMHLEIIGDKKLKIPDFDDYWAEILLAFYLFKDPVNFKAFAEHQQELERLLRKAGALENRQINFAQNKRMTSILTSSISKLTAIQQIVNFEHGQLGSSLRLVILSDFIRKEFYVNTTENNLELNKIGVISIFEKLRRQQHTNIKIGVLTGSLVIIPKTAYPAFKEHASKYNIKNINCNPVPFDENYLLIEQSQQLKHDIVHVVTHIFQQGEIEVLIGTKSLLGEGWDAPAINTLILASFVGSFVSSNQMRGRAIRTHRGCLEKTGNIWHLACVDPTSSNGGQDIDLLKRRFKGFVGISLKKDGGIENGASRLNLSERFDLSGELDRKNLETFRLAADRQSLKTHWDHALEKGISLVEEIKIPFLEEQPYQAVKQLYLRKTISNLIASLAFGWSVFLETFIRSSRYMKSANDVYTFLKIAGLIGFVLYGRLAIKTLLLYIKYRDISKDIQKIGEALLNSLISIGMVKTEGSILQVVSSIDSSGAVLCRLEGGSTFEKSSFINALQEILAPIENPKYVIVRKGMFMRFLEQKDYHAVPEVLSRNKAIAVYFKDEWEKIVGPCDLIFSRTISGRKILLKSRIKSLASQFENKIERVNKWRK
ncbi:DEAD/DEAH box helicase family protein [Pedobacter sp. MC2016-24]|uniref:DEAD/DEAH box helicase family protein n=1 Tax=Pedobacter sp. MC2016-24 TaxID=2780090 RepID=UPI001881BAC3|nr:DEAD/DEAH box helicase family protein [Pedobacter sp. MC2016-24]MBE9600481.1 DEAD/DEAH box helicase family protein [Pedobacter sp. MC2016-24]